MSNALARQRATWIVVAILALIRLGAAADDSVYDVDQDHALSLRALLDVRVVGQGPRPSVLEGGPGKTRYGGIIENGQETETITRFAVSQFALQPAASLPWGIRAEAQLNWDIDIDTNGDWGAYTNAPRLVEGWLRKEWGGSDEGWALQGGVMTPRFSLENTGPAWTPQLTLTPSAANTWLWEDVKPVGLAGRMVGLAAGQFPNQHWSRFGLGPRPTRDPAGAPRLGDERLFDGHQQLGDDQGQRERILRFQRARRLSRDLGWPERVRPVANRRAARRLFRQPGQPRRRRSVGDTLR